MIHWLSGREELEAEVSRINELAQRVECYIDSKESLPGYCSCCREIVTFAVCHPRDGGWTDLRESIQCKCGLNGRMRMVWSALAEVDVCERFLMMERVTPFFHRIERAYPFVEGCEYFGDDCTPGSYHSFGEQKIRHESMLHLSYDSNTFNYLFHGDVLEHVPDYRKALGECYRVLKPGGTLLFTTPFFFIDKNVIRSALVDGALQHYLPAAYHGNPVNAQGSLVFTEFGWELLEDICNAGFSKVSIGLLYDPFQGIVSNHNPYPEGHMWPLVFKSQK